MDDAVLRAVVDKSGVKTGMAAVENEMTRAAKNIKSEFQNIFSSQLFAATGAAAYLTSVVDKAHEIHHEAERFGIDAQQLQLIGNAAAEDGIQLGLVARTMNLLEINGQKALAPMSKQAQALQQLGIDTNYFVSLDPAGKFLAVADAYAAGSKTGADYAAVAQLIGARNTEMLPILAKGGDAIRKIGEDMGVMSSETVERLNEVHKSFAFLRNELTVTVGTGIGYFVASWKTGVFAITQVIQILVDSVVQGMKVIDRALHFDFKGAVREWHQGFEEMKADIKSVADYQQEQFGKFVPKTPTGGGAGGGAIGAGIGDIAAGSIGGLGGGGGGGGGGGTSGLDRIKKIMDQFYKETMSDQQRLNMLQERAKDLREEYFKAGNDVEAQDQARANQLENELEIQKLQDKMSQDQADYDEKRAKLHDEMLGNAQEDLIVSKEQTKEEQLTLQGRKDLADRAKIEFDYDEKIKKATQDKNKAEKEGLTDVAATNAELIKQLNIEKGVALAANEKAEAEKRMVALSKAQAATDDEQKNLDAMKEEQKIQDLMLQGLTNEAELEKTRFDYETKIKDMVGKENDLWVQIAKAYQDGDNALAAELTKHAKIVDLEVQELKLEEQKTLAMKQQQQIISQMNAAGVSPSRYADAIPGTLQQSGTGWSYTAGNGDKVDIAAPGVRGDAGMLGAMAAAGVHFGNYGDVLKAQGDNAGYFKFMAKEQLESLTGRDMTGWYGRLMEDRAVQQFAAQQAAKAEQASNIAKQQQIDFWGNIYSGHSNYNSTNPYAAMYGMPNMQTGGFSPLDPNSMANVLLKQLQASGMQGITLTEILAQITQVNKNTETVHLPGGMM